MLEFSRYALAASFVLASAVAASSQTGNDNISSQEKFREHITCAAYWKIQIQCLPSIVPPQQRNDAQQLFEQLVSTADTITEWLGEKSQISSTIQRRLEHQSKERLFSSIGGKCERAPALVSAYRDRCAKLFTANGDKLKAEYDAKVKDDLSDAQTIKDTQLDCDGTLQANDEDVPIGKERKATGSVHIMGGGVLMMTVRPDGMSQGMLTGQIIGAKPHYLRYKVISSTFKIGHSEPRLVGIDRVNAEVAVMLHGEKNYTFWLKCKVRKPQF